MANRNFSMTEYFNRRAKDWVPELHFRGKTKKAPPSYAATGTDPSAKSQSRAKRRTISSRLTCDIAPPG